MSKPIIPMHSPDFAEGRCHALCSFQPRNPKIPSVTVYNGCCDAAISASLQRFVSLRSLSDWQVALRVESQP